METTLQAGYHKLVITPPMGLKIPGYFNIRLSDGIKTDLFVRAVAFTYGEKKALIMTCDALFMTTKAAEIIKEKLAQRCGIEKEAVLLHCIHSHTSFRVETPEGEEPMYAGYLHWVYQRFVDCAQFAFEDCKDCTVKYAQGAAKGIAFIRTYLMKDGSVRTNPGVGNPDVVKPYAQQDDSVQLIRICREGGKEILMAGFATHADTVGGTKYCGDWPGFLCQTLEASFEGQVEAVTLVGCQGNSNHINVFAPKGTKLKGEHIARTIARSVAGEVLKIYDKAVQTTGTGIAYTVKEAVFGKNAYDPADIPEAEEIRRLYREIGNNTDPVFAKFKLKVNEALRILANLDRPEFFHIPVYGLRIGGIGFVGMHGEPFQSIGLAVKEASELDMTLPLCLINGYSGYFPDADAFAIPGSYEQGSSPFAANCGEKLVEAAAAALKELGK